MRITTQMLNQSAQKSGAQVNRMSLLDVLNGSGSSSDPIQAKNTSLANKLKKVNFEKMEASAEELKDTASKFVFDIDGIFKKAGESGDTKEIVENVEDMVAAYNDTLKNLRASAGTMDRYYLQQLQKAVDNNAEQLKELGITKAKDGSLKIDSAVLGKAKAADLEAVFGEEGSFSKKMVAIGEQIAENAEVNLESLSTQYTANGNLYSATEANKYDTWG